MTTIKSLKQKEEEEKDRIIEKERHETLYDDPKQKS